VNWRDIKSTAVFCKKCDKSFIVKGKAHISQTLTPYVKARGTVVVCQYCKANQGLEVGEHFDFYIEKEKK